MRKFVPRTWASEDTTSLLTSEPAPPASELLLRTAEAYPVEVAVTPYVGCFRVFNGVGDNPLRYIGQVVPPGTDIAYSVVVFGSNPYSDWSLSGTSYSPMIETTYGGGGANVVYILASPDKEPSFPSSDFSVTTSWDEVVAPTAPMDRAIPFETLAHPHVDQISVTYVTGFQVITIHVSDLEELIP